MSRVCGRSWQLLISSIQPRFLTKEQRAKLAIEKRAQEIKEQREKEERAKRDREALEREAEEFRQKERERDRASRYGGGGGGGRSTWTSLPHAALAHRHARQMTTGLIETGIETEIGMADATATDGLQTTVEGERRTKACPQDLVRTAEKHLQVLGRRPRLPRRPLPCHHLRLPPDPRMEPIPLPLYPKLPSRTYRL